MERKMIKKIEAGTLEQAYEDAATFFECSITDLQIEVVQNPSNGFMGFFKKSAILIAVRKNAAQADSIEEKVQETPKVQEVSKVQKAPKVEQTQEPIVEQKQEQKQVHTILNDTIMPASFVSDQDEEDEEDDEDLKSGLSYTADYDDEYDESEDENGIANIHEIANTVALEINELFDLTCFSVEKIDVSVYDSETLLVEFKGEDAALLIGKEGYRYKALSYMLFNWINFKYGVQLRLEIAEFLKNQEESITRYLGGVYESVERDGRAQTKILDGVLVQIALKELRERYPDKYVVIRSTRDGLKYIIINDYHSN
jgi:spoIIIJ-associated protein